jgi:catechol 2,3-dioxygenase-like lactoylglutathione lyase family enzyme
MNWTLEVVVVPVSDIDRAKAFYADQLGFAVDFDTRSDDGAGFVQLTPPGSSCSIMLGRGLTDMTPGSLRGPWLVVPDLRAARETLVRRGVDVSDFQLFDADSFRPYRDGDDLDLVGFVFVTDPDGNRWGIQQIASRG